MKNLKYLISLSILIMLSLTSCSDNKSSDEPQHPNPETPVKPIPLNGFAKGADISWVTEMEASGKKFYNSKGIATDCFQLMKDLGMNSIRLRVWLNPEKKYGKWSDADDVVKKAVRATKLGLHVMIDFHYSDFFADPGQQTKPSAWTNYSFEQLKSAITSHTTEVLSRLKEKGITPDWIQVGNETRNGMLWPDGQIWTNDGEIPNGWKNYATLSNAGYDACKKIYPAVKVIVHNSGAEEDLAWWCDSFKNAGGKFDVIGLSFYPQTIDNITPTEANSRALANIKNLGTKYNVPVMVCEVGVKTNANETAAATILSSFISEAKLLPQCSGVFYWEPEVYGSWKPEYYTELGWNAYDMGAFSANGRPSKVLNAFATIINE